MVDFYSSLTEIILYPLYHFADDAFMGILFYMLLFFWVLGLVFYIMRGFR